MGLLALLTAGFSLFGSSADLFTLNVVLLTALGAVALTVLMGTAGQVSIGNAAFLAVGAFATVFANRVGVPAPLDILVGVLCAAAVGGIASLPALRLRGLYLALGTLALHFIVVFVAERYQRAAVGVGGFYVDPAFARAGLTGSQRYWSWVLLGILGLTLVAASRVMAGKTGRAWRMIRDHEDAAAVLGIPVARSKAQIWVLSSAVIGLQGGITVHFSGSLTAESFSLALAVSYVAMVLIGGLDSLIGAVIGAAVVGMLPTLIPKLIAALDISNFSHGPAVSQIVYGVLLVTFVVASSDGIVGAGRRRWTSWLNRRAARPSPDR